MSSRLLDKAWIKAEEALPEPGYLSLSGPFGKTVDGPYDDHYNVSAYIHRDRRDIQPGQVHYPIASASGPTPAAALLALRDRIGRAIG